MAALQDCWVNILSESITKELCEELCEQGWAMKDNIFGQNKAQQLVDEIQTLSQLENGFKQHNFQFGATTSNKPSTGASGDNAAKIFRKPNIFEVDMHDSRVQSLPLPYFKELFQSQAIQTSFSRHLPHMGLINHEATLKIQKNIGNGGCFPLHYDNPGPPNRRALTCLFYLNAEWQDGDGGEVELQPFLGEKVTLAPLFDRLVIFESDKMLHRVLPSKKERLVFTLWIDGEHVNNMNHDINLKQKHIDLSRFLDEPASTTTLSTGTDEKSKQENILKEKVAFFMKSPLQRVISRVVYEEDYEASLKQCMIEAAKPNLTREDLIAGKLMLAEHHAYVKSLKSNPMLNQFLVALLDWKNTKERKKSLP